LVPGIVECVRGGGGMGDFHNSRVPAYENIAFPVLGQKTGPYAPHGIIIRRITLGKHPPVRKHTALHPGRSGIGGLVLHLDIAHGDVSGCSVEGPAPGGNARRIGGTGVATVVAPGLVREYGIEMTGGLEAVVGPEYAGTALPVWNG